MLLPYFKSDCIEVGVDEAGRGCLSGDVFAAAVILLPDFKNEMLNDSKQLSEAKRNKLRAIIEAESVAWAVGVASVEEIDNINILNASILAMHRAIEGVQKKMDAQIEHILVDGNRFKPFQNIPYTTVVKGDGKYMSVAAASILAKTHRDEYMDSLHTQFPNYEWNKNKGYPTQAHREAIGKYGVTSYHRQSFRLLPEPTLFDNLETDL